MRACLQTSVISFAVDVWSRHATGGENALRDEIKQLKTMIAKKKKDCEKKKGKSLYRPKWPMWRVLNSGFLSMKRLGGLLLPPLDGMLIHRRVTPSIFTGTHLYNWVKRSTVRVKRLAQEHNTRTPARARTRTTRSGVERTNMRPPRLLITAAKESTIFAYNNSK